MNDEASKVSTTPEEWLQARYPDWSERKIGRYIARHEPYKGTGRAPRKTATRKTAPRKTAPRKTAPGKTAPRKRKSASK